MARRIDSPNPPPRGFGGEEWVEELLALLRGDADTGVANLEQNRSVLGESGNAEPPLPRNILHGLAGVEEKIQQDLMDLLGVANKPQRRFNVDRRFDSAVRETLGQQP